MRLIDADEIMKALSIFNDTTNGNSHFLNGIETAKEVIEAAPTAFDVKMLMVKLATLDRIARSDKQKALLGRVFLIIENMIEENEKEQNDEIL